MSLDRKLPVSSFFATEVAQGLPGCTTDMDEEMQYMYKLYLF